MHTRTGGDTTVATEPCPSNTGKWNETDVDERRAGETTGRVGQTEPARVGASAVAQIHLGGGQCRLREVGSVDRDSGVE